MTKLVDPISSYMSESEHSRNFAFAFDINFWIPITEVCWSSKSLPSCPMHDCDHKVCIPPSQFFPAGEHPHIHVRLPKHCCTGDHQHQLCPLHEYIMEEHMVVILSKEEVSAKAVQFSCGPFQPVQCIDEDGNETPLWKKCLAISTREGAIEAKNAAFRTLAAYKIDRK